MTTTPTPAPNQTMPPLIDTHVHFDDARFDADRDSVYHNAQAAGVDTLIVPATTRDSWQNIIDLSNLYPGVYATAGLHPVFIAQHKQSDLADLAATLINEKCIAVGECGLDRFHKQLDYGKQIDFFKQQIHIAKATNLPLIIHARNAVEDVIQLLKPSGTFGVIHSYNGSLEQAQQLIKLGFLLSFGGAITYDRATRLRKMITELPLTAIMVETDAPDQPASQYYRQRNEPAFLPGIVDQIAGLKGISSEELTLQSNANAQRLFGIGV